MPLRHRVALLAGSFALSVLTAACASSHSAPRPFPTPVSGPVPDGTRTGDPADRAAERASGASAWNDIVALALQLRGTPYKNGGADPSGFDCSGFTQYVFGQAGRRIPRDTRAQFQAGSPVRVGQQRAGDLIFFTTIAPGASHVGIALGGDTFVHAPSSRGVVRVESTEQPYWSRRLVGIRRIGAD